MKESNTCSGNWASLLPGLSFGLGLIREPRRAGLHPKRSFPCRRSWVILSGRKEPAMPFCPQCGYEYEEKVKVCPDCEVKLVDQLLEEHFDGEMVEVFRSFSPAEA